MISHLVFFKMLEQAEGASGEDNAEKLIQQLRALPAAIPELVDLKAGTDFSCSEASYDVGLSTRFKSVEDLEIYRVHPKHQKVIEFVKLTTASRAVVDFTEED